MREILFRGFHKCETGKDRIFFNGEWIQGEWVEGYVIKNYTGHTRIYPRTYIGYLFGEHDIDVVEVIPETVGQYTGRKFKDKKCFTGDIIFARHSKILVDFDEDYLAYFTYYFDETKATENCWR